MSLPIFKRTFLVLAVIFFISSTAIAGETLQSMCTKSWMKQVNDLANPVEFKNFGEKYCDCISKQRLNSDEEMKKAKQLCMSRTLLHDSMDTLEDDVGLSDAKGSDVMDSCQHTWSIVYPKLSDEDKKFTTDYCLCAKPKLIKLIKKADDLTDKAYYDQIDSVAAACSGVVQTQ